MPRTNRVYTKRQKLSAVMAAEMVGQTQASKQSGIPKSTIHRWLDDPAMAQVRTRTREDLADEIKAVAHQAWEYVSMAMRNGQMEPRDAIFAAEKATSLQILLTGGATARTELRDLTGTLSDDDVRAAIQAASDLLGGGPIGTGAPSPGAPAIEGLPALPE